MIVIDAPQTRELLPFGALIATLKEAFRAGATVPLRHTHTISSSGGTGTSLIMPAWNETGFFGVKTVNIFPENSGKGLPGLHSVFLLFDAGTGVPLAQIDGNTITARRTAAAAALAASFLARADSRELLVVGSGRVAALLPAAFASVRPIERVRVWNVRPASARKLVDALRGEGCNADVAEDLESAARQADIVSCASLATEPLIRAEWLRAGSHLDLVGSFSPAMKEAHPDCFARAAVYVDTEEAAAKAGDLLDAFASGALRKGDIVGTLSDLCRGSCAQRSSARQRTVFKAVGTALEDLAAAVQVWEGVNRISLTSPEIRG